MEKVVVVIFAGGSGVRMGAGKPKQFLEVGGKPIIIHTLEIFEEHPAVDEIYVACKEDHIDKLRRMIGWYGMTKVAGIVPGGTTAMGSIYNGLKAARENNDENAIVLIHDGVRPLINAPLVDKVVETVREKGNAVTCTPMYETPVVSTGGEQVERTPARSDCYTAQAPQGYRLGEIIDAHETERKTDTEYTGIVDNCMLMRKQGRDVAMVIGPRSNIKVTTPEDLFIFKAMIEYRETRDALGL